MKTVFFVRHGQAEGNVNGCFQTAETPLTDIGHQQAEIVAKRCLTLDAELLVSSSMKRAYQTAEHIQTVVDLPIVKSDHFTEVLQASSVHGTSRITKEAEEYLKASKEIYIKNGERYEDAENYQDVQARVKSGLAFLVERPEDKIIVTTHGNFLKSILIHVLHSGLATGEIDLAMKSAIEYSRNTGLNVFTYDNEKGWRLEIWNDHAHFGEYVTDSYKTKS